MTYLTHFFFFFDKQVILSKKKKKKEIILKLFTIFIYFFTHMYVTNTNGTHLVEWTKTWSFSEREHYQQLLLQINPT